MINSTTRLLLILALGLSASNILQAQTLQLENKQATIDAFDRLTARNVGPTSLRKDPRSGFATFLSMPPGAAIAGTIPANASAGKRASGFIQSYGPAFGIFTANNVSMVKASAVDAVGMEHVRYQQTYQGIPVTGGEITLHLDGSNLTAANAKTLADIPNVSVTANIPLADAQNKVHQILEKRFGITDADVSNARLEIFNRGMLEARNGQTRLAWFIEAKRIDLRQYFWIDAQTGLLLLDFSQLPNAKTRQIYDANDPGDGVYNNLPGVLVRSEGGPAAAIADANDAYDYSGDTYDYFLLEHGRDSYDDAGAPLISTVRFCPDAPNCPFANAFWNGTQMVYGLGFPAADDVDAHELTHAVTEHSANLFYYMQSGALNESFSDIFGEAVDLTNSGGTDTAGVRWQMGEDVPGFGAIRDMSDPTIFGDPGKVSDTEFHCEDTDNGGVHINSGVPNHAFALMVDGGSYNGESISGIGLTKAGKIQYRTLTYYLTSASDFLNAYDALQQSCRDLIGTDSITAADCSEVTKALNAVEMSDPWPCTPAQASTPDYCPASQAPVFSYSTDFESGGLADCPSNALPTNWCLNTPGSLLGTFASSGVNSVWGYNRPSAGTIAFADSVGTLPAASHMRFNHSFGFEEVGSTYYDGGVIQRSNNGSTWFDAGSLISGGQNYSGTLTASATNPLTGMSAFVEESSGFVTTQLDLSSLGGQDFYYRFMIGTDNTADDYGWFVDDIEIFSCTNCIANWVLSEANNDNASSYEATSTVTADDGFRVAHGQTVSFQAGTSISLNSGFHVVTGGTFSARIAACAAP